MTYFTDEKSQTEKWQTIAVASAVVLIVITVAIAISYNLHGGRQITCTSAQTPKLVREFASTYHGVNDRQVYACVAK